MTVRNWTRRGLIGSVLAAGLEPAAAGTTGTGAAPRVVALDWGWASTLVGLGIVPAGVAETRLYADWVRTPALPPGVPDVGLRATPSLETLVALKPDLILTNALNAKARLAAIAPTLDSPVFAESRTPLVNAKAAARLLGERIGRPAAAEVLVATCENRIAAARARLAGIPPRPLIPVQMLDPRHLTVYGRGSLFDDTLAALGLVSAFTGPTSLWGHAGRSVADIADFPPADILLVAPVPADVARALDGPGLLAKLLALNGSRVHRLPPAWTYGDILAAAHFAEIVAEALVRGTPA